ncbi:MAG: DNA modification methylase [Fimbriiglobus sp.]
MQIELRSLSSLRPYPGNPRVNDDAVEAVARSLREFGFRQPIVVDVEGVIVVGHTRFKAAQKLGLTEVPVHVAHELTPTQTQAYRIADNQTATIATWDDDKLVTELLALRDQAYDLNLTGFDDDMLAQLLGDGEESELTGDPDDIPETPIETITQPGDLWHLGPHRLICGDATSPEAFHRLLGPENIDLLLTDPPYNVRYVGKTSEALDIANDDMADDDYLAFLTATLGPASSALKPGASFYIWHADVYGHIVRQACADVGLPLRQVLIWVKSCFALGRQDYHWQHEPCLYGWKPGQGHTWFGGRAQSTTLTFDKPARNGEHPTMKPVALFQQLLENSCPKGGLVLDPFGGSGTTLIAAQATGRVARLVELDPAYCDVIVSRWEKLTGFIATKSEKSESIMI